MAKKHCISDLSVDIDVGYVGFGHTQAYGALVVGLAELKFRQIAYSTFSLSSNGLSGVCTQFTGNAAFDVIRASANAYCAKTSASIKLIGMLEGMLGALKCYLCPIMRKAGTVICAGDIQCALVFSRLNVAAPERLKDALDLIDPTTGLPVPVSVAKVGVVL